MTMFNDLETLLTGLGYKVFPVKKVDSVNQAIVYKSISQRMIGSHNGQSDVKIERVQISHFALRADTLQAMVKATEDALGYHNGTDFTSIPLESKIESFDEKTSTFFSFRDYMIVYKE